MNLFEFSLKFNNFPIDHAKKELRKIQSFDRDTFLNWQKQKLFEIAKYHYFNNSLYASLVGKDFPSNFSQLPIIKKSELQIPFEKKISNNFSKKNVFINNTSGSSGTPLIFAKDKFSHAMTWALAIDRYAWHGIEYGKSLQARFYGIPLSGAKYYKEKLKDLLSARIRFPVFNLSETILENFISKFQKYPFEYLNGYTSSLVYFAKYCISKNLVLKDICPTLKVCIPTSEMVLKEDREILVKGFGIPVVNEYGCAEIDIIALEDRDGDWIISNENVFVEILDDENRPVEPGNIGRIILTSLHNKAMPFIRYEVGDRGSVSLKTKGNYQILESLEGRTNEFAILPSGRKVPALTFYYITKSLIKDNLNIREFVVRQMNASTFRFEYVSSEEISDDLKNKIKIAMDTYLEKGLTPIYKKVDFIERTKSGKLRQFYREF